MWKTCFETKNVGGELAKGGGALQDRICRRGSVDVPKTGRRKIRFIVLL